MSTTTDFQVPKRPIGSQGLVVSAQGLGTNKMSSPAAPEDEEAFLNTVARGLELGINFIDTAWLYGNAAAGAWSETLLGKAIAKHGRDSFIIATKFGYNLDRSTDSSPETIRSQLQDSLSRLGTDYIDLYYQHRADPNTPIETVMQTLEQLVEEGKIKYIGLSECTAGELRRAHAVYPITAIQMEWSLFSRDIEAEIVPTARELGVGIVPYFPLGVGMLTGAITSAADISASDFRNYFPRFSAENLDTNLVAVQRVRDIAAAKGHTPAQVALAWLHAQGDDVFPIPGTTKAHRIEENARGALIQLTPEEIEQLSSIQAVGDRYPNVAHTWNSRV